MEGEELYRIREEGLRRVYDISSFSAEELSNKKIRERLLGKTAGDIQKHEKTHVGGDYEMKVKDETCKRLIEEGISSYEHSRWIEHIAYLTYIGSGPIGGIFAYIIDKATNFNPALSPVEVGLMYGIFSGMVGLFSSCLLLDYLENKTINIRKLLKKLKINIKERK